MPTLKFTPEIFIPSRTLRFTPEIFVEDEVPPVVSVGTCEEIGRVTRNHVSAHQRDRVHSSTLYANERRCLVTNFNGAIPVGREIKRAVWEGKGTEVCAMSNPAITGRAVQVTIAAQFSGKALIRVDAVLDNGEIYSAWHEVRVLRSPMFHNDGWINGPSRLEVEVN